MINFMDIAFKEALKAYKDGEVPIGAVIVRDGVIITRGHNKRETKQLATAHAEIIAIEKACKKLSSWRLDGCEMYVTVEPCLMCAGAALNARLNKVYYGAEDFNGGAGRIVATDEKVYLNSNTEFIKVGGEERCSKILTDFFSDRRKGVTVNERSHKRHD